jgi:cellulose synthase/poly-beta-1,6-N-acetylglucosamine synthase-like glycosyltransferase
LAILDNVPVLIFVFSLNLVCSLALAVFGLHLYLLAWWYRRRVDRVRRDHAEIIERFWRDTPEDCWPVVTTQVPIYNERFVARRVIEAVARMTYPQGRHEVQVLDDSDDDTREIIDHTAARLRAAGYDVKVIRRRDRAGFKAGALAVGLETCRGELVAVFDADFVPPRDFLRRSVPLLLSDPQAACAQGRWDHLNPNESWLTKAQSLGIDGHFGIEQGARGWNGYLMNFNGTAGIWRKAAIQDPAVGGWKGDTITEDLDLSYRAQMAGWKIIYCIDLPCPAELPGHIHALKTQQRRWAKGSIQTAVKLLPRLWGSSLSLAQKVEGTIHLTHYLVSVGMILLPIVSPMLLLFWDWRHVGAWIWPLWVLIYVASVGPPVVYAYSRYRLGGGLSGLKLAPLLMTLGIGLCVNNGVAAISGLFHRGGTFERTPKAGDAGVGVLATSNYQPLKSVLWVIELALGAYCLAVGASFVMGGFGWASFYLVLSAVALLTVGWISTPWMRPRPTASADAGGGTRAADGLVEAAA